jgi:peptidyl-prolyl cis-trans isomerase SurA
MSLAGCFLPDARAHRRRRAVKSGVFLALAVSLGALAPLSPARAQAVVETVNGRPITDVDIEQRMKLLRILREPASREAAIQSLVDDQLKLQENSLYQIKPTDEQVGGEIARTAQKMKIAPQAFFAEIQRAGISEMHLREHFGAQVGFLGLIQAFHKGVEASESQIRAEMAKEGGKAAATEYRLRQIIFVTPAKSPEAIKGRMEAAQQLRLRFTDCASGLPLARGMDNVAVKDEVVSSSSRLTPALKQMFDKTEVGHLTAPQRTGEGIEMIAICGRTASNDDTALRAQISERLLDAELQQDAARRLKELRSHAVIVKP